MANYKHKRTGLVVEYTSGIYKSRSSLWADLDPSLVEDSCDWEKIEDFSIFLKPKFIPFETEDHYPIHAPTTVLYIASHAGHKWYGKGEIARDFIYAREWTDFFKGSNNSKIFLVEDNRDRFVRENNKSKVLLTTEDGVKITDKDTRIWDIQMSSWLKGTGHVYDFQLPLTSAYKVFSSEAKRDEYIIGNKPLLSTIEVEKLLTASKEGLTQRTQQKLISLAKSKL